MITSSFNEDFRAKLESVYIHLDRDVSKSKRSLNGLRFTEDTKIEPHTGFYAGEALCSMGSFSYSNSPVQPGFKIGRYCSLSWGITVTGPRHPYEWVTISNLTYDKFAANVRGFAEKSDYSRNYDPRVLEKPMPIVGNDVWIGQNVTINRGVEIGDGAVVAAFSLVTKSIPPFEIWGGNPAKKIKDRFPEKIRRSFAEIEWWKYDFGQFQDLDLRDVEGFIKVFEENPSRFEEFCPEKISAEMLVGILEI